MSILRTLPSKSLLATSLSLITLTATAASAGNGPVRVSPEPLTFEQLKNLRQDLRLQESNERYIVTFKNGKGHCIELVNKNKATISNIDVTILLQKPKLRNYIDLMREKLSKIMKIEISQISIKATTTEGLGFVGREEGVAAHCVCLIKE